MLLEDLKPWERKHYDKLVGTSAARDYLDWLQNESGRYSHKEKESMAWIRSDVKPQMPGVYRVQSTEGSESLRWAYFNGNSWNMSSVHSRQTAYERHGKGADRVWEENSLWIPKKDVEEVPTSPTVATPTSNGMYRVWCKQYHGGTQPLFSHWSGKRWGITYTALSTARQYSNVSPTVWTVIRWKPLVEIEIVPPEQSTSRLNRAPAKRSAAGSRRILVLLS